jgi:NAD(P)-dependent dehydrogenase (short-subunit alcohol dehydrogenase family)
MIAKPTRQLRGGLGVTMNSRILQGVFLILCWGASQASDLPLPPVSTTPAAPVALITGSDRGIGFALTQELTSRGWMVIATCRDPSHAQALRDFAQAHPGVSIEALDVSDNAAIDALAARYRARPIDALINNAGITGDFAAQRLNVLDAAAIQQVMRVNAYAPLRLAQAFLEQVSASHQKKIIAISSGSGSLFTAPQAPDSYFYNTSKAALNMGLRLLYNDVRGRGILVGIVSPGPVDTDMQKAYRANAAQAGKPLTLSAIAPADSARALANYIEGLSIDKAGRFWSAYTGQELPW